MSNSTQAIQVQLREITREISDLESRMVVLKKELNDKKARRDMLDNLYKIESLVTGDSGLSDDEIFLKMKVFKPLKTGDRILKAMKEEDPNKKGLTSADLVAFFSQLGLKKLDGKDYKQKTIRTAIYGLEKKNLVRKEEGVYFLNH